MTNMYKTPPLIMNNHEDSKLLVEFVIYTLRMREMEITASIEKFILRIPKSPFNHQNIFIVAYIIMHYSSIPLESYIVCTSLKEREKDLFVK